MMLKKKILFVTSALGGGGAEKVLSILVNYFYQQKYNVRVISLISSRAEYTIPKDVENIFIGGCKSKTKRTFDRYFKLKNEIKKYQPDLIISFGYAMNMYSILANRNFKYKMIVSERNDPNISPKSSLIRKVRNYLYKKVDYFVFQTPDARKYFKNINDNQCSIICNPVSDNLPEYQPGENKYILSVGRLSKQKNYPLLISAFYEFSKIHNDYKLYIAGEGEEKGNLIELINQFGLKDKVIFLGYRNDIYDFMSKAAMFVMTSSYEGISNAMLEAIAIGVPTICTDCPIGGAKMVIGNNENGILIPINDKEALLDAFCDLSTNKEKSIKISENGKKIKTKYSTQNICSEWSKIIKKQIN